MAQFNVDTFLKSQGLTLLGADESTGVLKVENQKGEVGDFSPKEFLRSKGRNVGDIEIVANSIETPVPISPLTNEQRSDAIAFGNTKGQVNYLKKHFEDAALSPEGLVVKHQGVWHKVDPGLFEAKDPWEVAKDLSDLGDVAISAGLTTAGAAIGTMLLPGIGTVIGAGIGGLLSGTARTSLGRVVGTYEATPEEQMKDIALESVLSLGGQAIGMGTRVGMNKLSGALKSIKTTAKEPTKDIISSVYGTLTGVQKKAMRVAIDNPTIVPQKINKAITKLGKGATTEAVQKDLGKKAGLAARGMLKVADRKLKTDYDEMFRGILRETPDNFSANVNKIAADLKRELVRSGAAGYKKTAIEKTGPKFKEFALQGDDLVDLSDAQVNKVFKFKTFGENIKDIAGANPSVSPDDIASFTPDEISILDDFFNSISKDLPSKVTGKNAARSLLAFKKGMNESFGNLFDRASPSAQRVLGKAREFVDNRVTQEFNRVNLGPRYTSLNSNYNKFYDSVREARKIVDNHGEDQLVKFFFKTPGTESLSKRGTMLDDLTELLGKNVGNKFKLSIETSEAARRFADWTPAYSPLAKLGGAAGVGLGVTSGAVGLPTALGVATQTSPRIVSKQLSAAARASTVLSQGLNFTNNLGPKQLKSLLADPDNFDMFIREMVKGMQDDQMTEELMGAAFGQ